MKTLLAKVGARDVFVGAGALICALGAGLIYLPAGVIVFGGIVLYLGLFGVPSWR